MTDQEYDIQTLVELSSVLRRTIYFYTQQGIIPPPRGAGLAARYAEIHLLRLRLIPLLRRSGLRLDDIRRQLDGMDIETMRRRLAEAPAPSAAPLPASGKVKDQSSISFIHYPLPAGITLIAPASLAPEEQAKLDNLLKTARQILISDHHESHKE
jgi:DNA-binding transcriptional MerR regulator